MRVKITLEYDGLNFNGWQEQEGKRTIQGELHKALYDLTKQRIIVHGSGRTDAGVSAKNQVAHFDIETKLSIKRLIMALNMRLPDEIRIKMAEIVDESFHSRYSTKKKTYTYHMYASSIESPLRRFSHYQVWPNLDFEAMKKACKYFVGTYDFKGFSHNNPQIISTIRTIYQCEMDMIGDDIKITICGDGFLHNMVRIICGTILKVGQRKIAVGDLEEIIRSGNRKRAGQTLPAFALVLENVEY